MSHSDDPGPRSPAERERIAAAHRRAVQQLMDYRIGAADRRWQQRLLSSPWMGLIAFMTGVAVPTGAYLLVVWISGFTWPVFIGVTVSFGFIILVAYLAIFGKD